jgi:shikimate kinase / 3-dehydroquinate synthase
VGLKNVTPNALGRHLALVGFMGAGKSSLRRSVAERLNRDGVDLDGVIQAGIGDIATFFAERGEPAFRKLETQEIEFVLAGREPAVLDLGGGAVTTPAVRAALAQAFVVFVDVDAEKAWRRVRGSDRPNAQDEGRFRQLYKERRPLYFETADAVVTSGDPDAVLLAAAGIHHAPGSLERLDELVPGSDPVALVADVRVLGLHGAAAQTGLGSRLQSVHQVPAGESAKQFAVVERLWSELRLDRRGTVVALGGGATTDVAGFAAATYLRGVPWVAVPTTLVGQVDASIGGKTAIDIPQGKNLVGAFHWPVRTVIDPTVLSTLPERERRQGEAERVKTELLAGRALDARAAAAYKAALCLRDPEDRNERRWLNLGHTFGHALEAAADFDLPHGEAVALGLLAALRLSGRDTTPVEEQLAPKPVSVDRDRAWEALLRDKKVEGGDVHLVLLGADGPTVEVRPPAEVRAALDSLIA